MRQASPAVRRRAAEVRQKSPVFGRRRRTGENPASHGVHPPGAGSGIGGGRTLARLAGGCYGVGVFGIGTSELLVVAVLALLLFPPKELPKILRSMSQLWGSLRRTADEFKDAIMQEEAMQDLKDAVEGTKEQLRDVEGAARRELMKARMEARRAENKLLKVAKERERIEREAAAKVQAETAAAGGATPAGGAAPADGAANPAAVAGSAGAASPAAVASAAASAATSPAVASSPAPSSSPVASSRPVPSSSPVGGSIGAPANTVAAGSSVSAGGSDDDAANQGAA